MRRTKSLAAAGTALAVLLLVPGVAQAQASLDKQLLTNPGAEAGMAAPGTSLDVVSIPGWDTKGSNFTVEGYTPEKDMYGIEQARINGGGAFFMAGSDGGGATQAAQDVDVSSLAADIDAGKVNAVLSAQLAGHNDTPDSGTVTATFLDVNKKALGTGITLGPYNGGSDRWVLFQNNAVLPAGTRTVEVALLGNSPGTGSINAFFDNLSLVLTEKAPPLPSPGPLVAQDLLQNSGGEAGMASMTGNDTVVIPGWTTTGQFTVMPYAVGDAPDQGQSDGIQGGTNVFSGGPGSTESTAVQTVDVTPAAAAIDAGQLRLHLWAEIAAANNAAGRVVADELDAKGNTLYSLQTFAHTADDSKFDEYRREGPMMPGTRSVRVTLDAKPGDTKTDSVYFDRVSLKLTPNMALPAPVPAPAGPVAAKFDTNLLVDPDAEQAMCDPMTDHTIVPVPGWTLTGTFSATAYVGSFGDVDQGEQDRINGGNCYFTGGYSSWAAAQQTVDVSNFAQSIDAGGVAAHIEAQMAGYNEQGDNGTLYVSFLDPKLSPLGVPLTLGPVYGTDPSTALYTLEQADGPVPAGTRNIQVMMVAQRTDGSFDDAYFDNLVLSLKQGGKPGDLNGDGVVDLKDATLALQIAVGLAAATPAQLAAGDLLHTGAIDLRNVTRLLQAAVGLIQLP